MERKENEKWKEKRKMLPHRGKNLPISTAPPMLCFQLREYSIEGPFLSLYLSLFSLENTNRV